MGILMGKQPRARRALPTWTKQSPTKLSGMGNNPSSKGTGVQKVEYAGRSKVKAMRDVLGK